MYSSLSALFSSQAFFIAAARLRPIPGTSRRRADSSLRTRKVPAPKASTIWFA